jgi:serine/threonine protein kinase
VSFVVLRSGSIFAKDFRIVKPLMGGGMGAVYVAEQLSTGALRALKVMYPQLVEDPRNHQRFENEARVGARIASDHVVQVVAAGVDDETGMPWLAMELLEGEDLGAYVRRVGPLPPAEVRDIFEQLVHGLSAAHDNGIVHRDLKPENIFLATPRRVGARYVVKLLDFGIAKFVADAQRETLAMGTPLWMAPEQTESGKTVDPSTDVWALGLLAYYLLTGTFYWRAHTSTADVPPLLLREIVVEPLDAASARAAQRDAADRLPYGFDAWFARCVDRERPARFPDARTAWGELVPLLPPPGSTAIPADAAATHVR